MRIQAIMASILAIVALVAGTGYFIEKNQGSRQVRDVAASDREAVVFNPNTYDVEMVAFKESRADSPAQDGNPNMHRLSFLRPAQGFIETPAARSTTTLINPSPPTVPVSSIYTEDFYLYARTVIPMEPDVPVVMEPSQEQLDIGNDLVRRHIVESGDTLWAIGLRYDTSWPALAELNSIPNPDLIYPGQAISLSNQSNSENETVSNIHEASNDSRDSVYTVRPGDSLSAIGYQHGIHWRQIAETNQIQNPDLIYPGNRLVLSTTQRHPVSYVSRQAPPVTRSVKQVAPAVAPVKAPAPVVREVVPAVRPVSTGGAIQSGIATWYGPGFEGNVTYCGQVYDSRQYTAASNTLPCGSVVTVSNQVTGASVTVTVTDRGGFGHAMDLSHAAFSAIAHPSAGVAPIVVTSAK